MNAIDRGRAVEVFRHRLLQLIQRAGRSQSAFAAQVGMDRSTLSQLLAPGNRRLPRAETVIGIARAGRVSVDWLLGESQDEGRAAELVRADMEIEAGAASPIDERLAGWHREASGYKIRYVPTTLPDLVKTEEVILYECPRLRQATPRTSLEQAAFQLSYSRHPDTEMEVCCPWQMLEGFALGEGVWRGLGADARRAQLKRTIRLVGELYPTFRWYLYDGLQHFSVPVTLFGYQRAVLYVGNLYFVFNTTEYIHVLASHFDGLVKVASVPPTDIDSYLHDLIQRIK